MSDIEAKKLEESNLALTKEVFFRFGSHDVDGIVELLHEDAHIEFYGPSEIPYAGDYRGVAECRKFFSTVLSSVDIHVFEPEEFICENDRVIVVGSLRLTTKKMAMKLSRRLYMSSLAKMASGYGFVTL